jgi:hypothetical protein
MAENLVTNLIAFALVSNVGGDDTAEHIRATAACATLGYNLIRILVVVPLIKTKVHVIRRQIQMPCKIYLRVYLK